MYWPALLLAAGLPLPDEVVVHGFLTVDGKKIGKSLGNALDPLDCIERYGCDALRYFLLSSLSPFEDGDFSAVRLVEAHDTDLANDLGNLANRLTTLWEKAELGDLEPKSDLRNPPEQPEGFEAALLAYHFDRALQILRRQVRRLNVEIATARPWESLSPGKRATLREPLSQWLRELHGVAFWLQPFLPGGARRLLDTLERNRVTASGRLFERLAGRAV